jgi:hypothetical protein
MQYCSFAYNQEKAVETPKKLNAKHTKTSFM